MSERRSTPTRGVPAATGLAYDGTRGIGENARLNALHVFRIPSCVFVASLRFVSFRFVSSPMREPTKTDETRTSDDARPGGDNRETR